MTDSPPSSAPQTPPQAAAADKAANGKPVPDRELLRRFVRLGDQAAFAALVRRHSGLVIGVCRRVLRSEHDIEDAFLASFLVLARDAGRIRKTDSLASWLHGVAYRTSLRAADSTRRRGRLLRELTMIEDTLTPADDSGPLADVEQRHQQQALDEELASLPDNYRAALVLHYLDGKSNQQVADELGLSVTAVEGRLKRGKKELRLRLARRGIGLSVAVAAMQAVQSSAQAAPLEPLIARAIDAGLSYAGGEAAGPVYSPEAARLAGQELMTMSTTTTATLAAVVLLPLALGFAGHAPATGPAGTQAVISTTLAQADGGDAEANPAALAADQQTDAAAPEEKSLEQVVTVEEKNGHVIIKYRKPDGEMGARVVILDDEAQPADAAPTGRAGSEVPDNMMDLGEYTQVPSSERNIAVKLTTEVTVEFVDTPLEDAVLFLRDQNDIPILIDEVALTDVGIPTDEPVNLMLSGITLQTALNHVLRPLGLTTIIRDEVLQVTTKDVADEYLVTRVYDISDLAGIEQEQLLKVLQESLPDAYWKDTDGSGGTASILDDALVVKQSQSAHRQIVDLLGQLRRHLQQRAQSSDSQTDETKASEMGTSQPAKAAPRKKELTLHIDADGTARHDSRSLTIAQLQELLQKELPSLLILRVDRSASSQAVSDIVEAAKAAGNPGMKFAMRAVDPADDAPATEADDDVSDAGDARAGWQTFSDERLTALLDDKKPVLVNFTADWCLVCKQNEKQALYTDATAELLKRHGIAALRADYTQPDEQIRTWLEKFGSDSVPLTVVFPKGKPDTPVVLNGALTQDTLLSTLRSAGGN